MSFITNTTTATSSGGDDNFSYETVSNSITVTIPQFQQMIVYQAIDIIGTLNIVGTLVVFDG